MHEKVFAEFRKVLEWKIIEPSHSTYSSPLLAVLEADGSVCLVLDAREMNKIIVPFRTLPKNLVELLQRFCGVKYLPSVDLRSSYWQLLLCQQSRKYTAFIFAGRCCLLA